MEEWVSPSCHGGEGRRRDKEGKKEKREGEKGRRREEEKEKGEKEVTPSIKTGS